MCISFTLGKKETSKKNSPTNFLFTVFVSQIIAGQNNSNGDQSEDKPPQSEKNPGVKSLKSGNRSRKMKQMVTLFYIQNIIYSLFFIIRIRISELSDGREIN